jgi:hypothetical protein
MRFLDPIRPRDGVLGTLFFLAAMALPGWVFFVHEGGPRSELEAAVIECSRHKQLWTLYLDREPHAVTLKADDALAPALPSVCPSGTRVRLVVRAKPRFIEPLYQVDGLEHLERGQVLLAEETSLRTLRRYQLGGVALMALLGLTALQFALRGVRGALRGR